MANLNYPIQNLRDEIIGSVKYLQEKTACIITLDNLNDFDKK
jgi:hypothetical protein